MSDYLKNHLTDLEAEYAALHEPLTALRERYEALREQARPFEQEMADVEAQMDAVRHSPRYKELAEQLPHLKKAVGT